MKGELAALLVLLAFPISLLSQPTDSLLNYTIEDSVKAEQDLKTIPQLIEKEHKYDDAMELAQKCRLILEKFKGKYSDEVSFAYHVTGVALYLKNQYRKALEPYLEAFSIRMKMYGENNSSVALTSHHIAGCYENLGEYEKSLEYNLLSLRIRKKMLGERSLEVAFSYNNIGNVYERIGKHFEAIDAYNKTIIILREKVGESHPYISLVLSNIAVCYNSLGRHDKAIDLHKKALSIRLLYGSEDSREVAESYIGLGNGYHYLGNSYESIRYHRKALDILTRLNGPEDITLRVVYMNLGVSVKSAGDPFRAIEYFQKSLDIALKYLEEPNPDILLCYRSIGDAYYQIGESDRAIFYYEKALKGYSAIFKEKNESISNCLYGIAVCNWQKREFDKAIGFHKEALLNFPDELLDKHPYCALIYNGIAACLNDKKLYNEAIPYYLKSIEVMNSDSSILKPDVIRYYDNIAYCYRVSGGSEQAIKYYNKALEIYNKIYPTEICIHVEELIDAYAGKAKVLVDSFYRSGNINILYEADALFEKALACSNCKSSNIETEKSKHSYYFQKKDIIGNIINVIKLIANHDNSNILLAQAFHYNEISKSNILLEGLIESGARHFAGINDSLLDMERRLQTDLSFFEKLQSSEEEKGESRNDSLMASLGAQVFTLRQQLDSLLAVFDKEYPVYKKLKYDLPSVLLIDVQTNLLSPTSTLLEYFTGDSSIFLFVVNKNDYQIKEIPKNFPLEDWVKQLQTGLSGYHALPANDPRRTNAFRDSCERDYISAARNLYDKLVKPVDSLLKEEVIIVPDGVLGYVPFEVLLTGPAPENTKRYHQYPYLLRDHRIRYTYSATLLKEMMDKKHRHEPAKSFAAFAPYYNGDTTVLAGLEDLFVAKTVTPGDLLPLKYSGVEVAAAQKLMGGDVFSDTTATEAHFNRVAGDYRILHLSTHGKADDRVGDYSYLVFSPQKDSIENELLYCRDIYNLSLNADLVVLSACETGLGKLSRGEGIISLARAFAYAGAKSIVNSLWSVNDASTQELMIAFYRGLKNGDAKSEALAEAKRSFLKEPSAAEKSRYKKLKLRWEDFRHPYFWGGFILIGDDAAVK